MLFWILITFGAVLLDQLTKKLAVLYLQELDTLPIIKDVIHLTYSENTGAAFGMLKDQRWIFLVFSSVAIIAIAAYLIVSKPKNKLYVTALAFVLAGGIGNMIDRIAYGYVVDFIDFTLIDFAIFNVADSFITVGACLLVLYFVLFETKSVKKNEDNGN
jgi:signal peptidase II